MRKFQNLNAILPVLIMKDQLTALMLFVELLDKDNGFRQVKIQSFTAISFIQNASAIWKPKELKMMNI